MPDPLPILPATCGECKNVNSDADSNEVSACYHPNVPEDVPLVVLFVQPPPWWCPLREENQHGA